jgi:outer membrane protein OmpA-like peptidoglycan-associated protein
MQGETFGRKRRCSRTWALVGMFVAASYAGRVQARPADSPWHVRLSLAGSTMISRDQVGWLGFDSFGLVGNLQLGYTLLPWLAARVSLEAGGFAGAGRSRTGGLLAPLLGLALTWPRAGIRPWLQVDAGLGFTGDLQRPLFNAGLGVDVPISAAFTLGPVLGYSQLFQHARPLASTDARFVWFGLVLGWTVGSSDVREEHRSVTQLRERVQVTHVTVEDRPVETPPSAAVDPSPELTALLEDALPTQRNEWLAPVLFALDSSKLEPQGVAMLHEVAHALALHPTLKLLEICGYADTRGDPEHNLTLSEQRANAVRAWLIAHGVAPERLRVAARGATDLIEPGNDEAEHEQNRRVIFRVLEQGTP